MAFIDCASWKPQNQNGEFAKVSQVKIHKRDLT